MEDFKKDGLKIIKTAKNWKINFDGEKVTSIQTGKNQVDSDLVYYFPKRNEFYKSFDLFNQIITKSNNGLNIVGSNQVTIKNNIFSIGEASYNRDYLFGMPLEINSTTD